MRGLSLHNTATWWLVGKRGDRLLLAAAATINSPAMIAYQIVTELCGRRRGAEHNMRMALGAAKGHISCIRRAGQLF